MQQLTGPGADTGPLTDDDLRRLYAVPRTPWLRVNMVATVDGAATGDDGRTGSINNAADKRVFDLLRDLADVLVVGAGTVRAEGYEPTTRPTVVVSRSGRVPPTLRGGAPGNVLMATCASSPGLAEAREVLGDDQMLVLGGHRVDLSALKAALNDRGFEHVLGEGGPHLLRDLLDQGVVDEVCATVVPLVVAGPHRRMTDGPPVSARLRLGTLLEEDGTLLARWYVEGQD
jgi:riboflavin biosynthesis pyrimidine reductase